MQLTIDELRILTQPHSPTTHAVAENRELSGSKTKIVICQRGWIFVGQVARDGNDIVISKAKNIRNWGTTRGLGELVSGPTAKTVLDDYGTFRVHELAVVGMLDCDDEKWGE